MALKEQKIIFTTVDADGNTVIYLPLTSIEQVEGAIKDISLNGQTLTVTFVDGTTKEFTTQSKEYTAMTGATASTAGKEGLVPAPAAGDQANKYLRADGTWQVPPDADTKYTHPDSDVTAGSYSKVTVDAKGHVIEGENPTTLSDYGITDAVSSSEVGNAANKIPQYNSSGHLVLPDGSEFWIG